MRKATSFTRNATYRVAILAGGIEDTVWQHHFTFDDGSTITVDTTDPRCEKWIAQADNYEPPAHMLDDGRDFTPPYEP